MKGIAILQFFPLLIFSCLLFKITQLNAQQLAFPGAEGFGRYTIGGRGGEVYHVTNLNDSGAGSFRDAVSKPYRIVVFDVGGIINISTRIVINHHIYVAGQTAPGGGITIYGNGIAFNGSSGNNIIRYIRIRMGKNGDSGKDAVAISEGQNYIFDHVSISWGRDGTFDVNGTGIDNITLQDCIVGQGINNSNHSTGGLIQSGKWSVIRSLYIDNKTRNPKARGKHEFINSVLYNWATNGYIMGDTEGLSECNLIGNYFIYGPSSSSNSHITNTTPSFNVYAEDNWVDSNKDGTLNGYLLNDYKTATVQPSAFSYPGVNQKLSAQNAFSHVIQNVGASFVRDAVDNLLINQVRSYGTLGQIINTEDDNGIPGNIGTVANGTPPLDTDNDGMPNDWEVLRGLNPNVADDKGDDDNDGYTNIEEYLSCLVGESDDCGANNSDCNGIVNGSAYIDNCDVCVGGNTEFAPCSDSMEAEEACTVDGIILENTNTGYSGAGYVNTTNALGASVTWLIKSNQDQTATFTFKFANGGSSARNGQVILNGNSIQVLSLPQTGSWANWSLSTVNLQLLAGNNELIVEATSADGLSNIDLIYFSSGLSKAGCVITGGNQLKSTSNLFIYPNPASDKIQWQMILEFTLLSAQGNEVARGVGESLDLTAYPSGLYFIKLGEELFKVFKK